MSNETVPSWPRIEAVAREDGTGEVVVDGASYPVAEQSLDQARVAIIGRVTETAERLGRPVRVSTNGPDGHWPLVVHPNGHVAADDNPAAADGAETAEPESSAAGAVEPVEPGVPTLPNREAYNGSPVPQSPRTALRPPAPAAEESKPDPPAEVGRWDQDSEDDSLVGELLAGDPPKPDSAVEVTDSRRLDWKSVWEPSERWNLRKTKKEDLPKLRFHESIPSAESVPSAPEVEARSDPQPEDASAAAMATERAQADLVESGAGASAATQSAPVEADAVPTTKTEAAGTDASLLASRPVWQTSAGSGDSTDGEAPGVTQDDQVQHDRAQFGQPQFGQPQFGRRQFGQPQSNEPPVAQPLPNPPSAAAARRDEAPADSPAPAPEQPLAQELAGAADPGQQAPTETGAAQQVPTDNRIPDGPQQRQSFLVQESTEEPASRGFRGFLSRAGFKVAPNELERSERNDMMAVSQHWPGPRTIAIVNGKGGANKTPTTILLSAVFALFGGAGVAAWDNNQTRGTLGWRTEQGGHEATLLDLLPEVPRLLSTGAQAADLAHFVHHQTRDRFDVLRSQPMVLAHEQRIEPRDVDAIHSVLGKYYRLIFIDSGNDESDPMWLRMIDHADQLVVATTTRNDHAEAGALLLEALASRDERSARLAQQSVAVITQADSNATAIDVRRVTSGYQSLTRSTVAIPFDPGMVDGQLLFSQLKPESQRAWLAAGAAVAQGL